MADLFGRRVRVLVATPSATPGDFRGTLSDVLEVNGGEGGAGQQGLRVAFNIKKTDDKSPNTAEVTITNLAPDQRGRMQKKPVKVVLEAGYQATGQSMIWRGDARTVDHVRNGADWNTTIKGGDGERAYRHARVSESFAAGVGAGTVLQYLAEKSGLQIGSVPTVVVDITDRFDHGYAVSGRWSDEMDRLVKSIGYTWSVQDETLQVLLPGQASSAAIPLISSDTGMVGSPEFGSSEKKGQPALVKIKMLLTPTRPGARFRLKSERYDGVVRVKKANFIGDTHGADWYTEIEGVISQ